MPRPSIWRSSVCSTWCGQSTTTPLASRVELLVSDRARLFEVAAIGVSRSVFGVWRRLSVRGRAVPQVLRERLAACFARSLARSTRFAQSRARLLDAAFGPSTVGWICAPAACRPSGRRALALYRRRHRPACLCRPAASRRRCPLRARFSAPVDRPGIQKGSKEKSPSPGGGFPSVRRISSPWRGTCRGKRRRSYPVSPKAAVRAAKSPDRRRPPKLVVSGQRRLVGRF